MLHHSYSHSPQILFSKLSWPSEDFNGHQQQQQQQEDNMYVVETETSGSGLDSPTSQQLGNITYSNINDAGKTMVIKKLNHNASERDRRKRINELYSSLRSLLPSTTTHHKKKLSIPATITRVLKYIPELEKEVENLNHKKQALLDKNTNNHHFGFGDGRKEETSEKLLAVVVSASRVDDTEILIQISMSKSVQSCSSFSETLLRLDQEGLLLLNMSTFESFQGRLFYNLHLQGGTQLMDLERLREKLLSSFYHTTPTTNIKI